jgi:hypothetical protein
MLMEIDVVCILESDKSSFKSVPVCNEGHHYPIRLIQ